MASLTPIPQVSTASSETPCPPLAATDASTIPGLTVAPSVAVTSGDGTTSAPPPGERPSKERSEDRSAAAVISPAPPPAAVVFWKWCLVARLSSSFFARSFRVTLIFGFVDEVVAAPGAAPVGEREKASGTVVLSLLSGVSMPTLAGPACCGHEANAQRCRSDGGGTTARRRDEDHITTSQNENTKALNSTSLSTRAGAAATVKDEGQKIPDRLPQPTQRVEGPPHVRYKMVDYHTTVCM